VPRAGINLLAEAGPAPGATRFAADSLLEREGFEPSVPPFSDQFTVYKKSRRTGHTDLPDQIREYSAT
jgi:hypothetical protein